ncbi:hypothetical protein MMC13_005533 [Lambiella insularis]|nr:hypothetical protein [Lambiella insularis]
MQLTTAVLTLLLLCTSSLATRSSTIKSGLRVVGNHAFDQAHAHGNAAADDHQNGFGLNHGTHMAAAEAARTTNHQLVNTVPGVRKVHRRDEGLRFVARDDTHEWYARSLNHPLAARWAEPEAEPEAEAWEKEFWYEY